MNYFLIETDPLYVDAPVLQDWNGKVDRTKIKPGLSHQLPARIILNIYPNAYTTFTDIVDFPFLLLSKVCMDVVKLYEPQIVSKQIILLDTENRNKQTYYLPILPHLDCLSEESVLSPDGSELREGGPGSVADQLRGNIPHCRPVPFLYGHSFGCAGEYAQARGTRR